jgi:xylulokinase
MKTPLYLGFDCSTQSFTAILIEQADPKDPASGKVVLEKSLNFDAVFPEFGTRNGVLPSDKPGLAHTPPQLWVKAMETLIAELKKAGIDLSRVAAIATSGQQHGSVYLNAAGLRALASLDPKRGLAEQMEGGYSRKTSPIWMDATTSKQCAEITAALGGDAKVCALTGSRVFERFTGPQIRKFAQEEPAAYAATREVLLVSSFIPSLLAGKVVGIDPGDGAGMSLMDLAARQWSGAALRATAPDLDTRLSPVVPSETVAGAIAPYYVERFGFSPACRILPGTGDNPASLVGLGLIARGRLGISLGTSDVLFAFMQSPKTDPDGNSHVFGSPTGAYMALSVYKNGSLAREAVRKRFDLTWEKFSEILKSSAPGNKGRILLPYFDTEIIPRINTPGEQRVGLDASDAEGHVRGVVEAQMTSMKLHSAWMGETPTAIAATGGASNNLAILQVMADVFGVTVSRQETTAAAALGAAVRAQHGYLQAVGQPASWEALTEPHLKPSVVLKPDMQAHRAYADFAGKYAKAEAEYVAKLR